MSLVGAYHSALLRSEKCLNYLASRGISLATAKALGFGYFDISRMSKFYDRLLYPVTDSYGNNITFQGRAMFDWKAAGSPKYYHGPFDKANVVCSLHENGEMIVEQNYVVLVEGPFDVAALRECRVPAVPLLSTALSDAQAFKLRAFTDEVVQWLDPDETGEKGTARNEATLKRWGFKVRNVRGVSYDPSDALLKLGAKKVQELCLTAN